MMELKKVLDQITLEFTQDELERSSLVLKEGGNVADISAVLYSPGWANQKFAKDTGASGVSGEFLEQVRKTGSKGIVSSDMPHKQRVAELFAPESQRAVGAFCEKFRGWLLVNRERIGATWYAPE